MRSDGHRPDEDELGPVDYLAVEFPGGRITAPGFDQLMSLVRQGTIRILDAEFVVKDPAGSTRRAEVGELDGAGGTDLSAWAGASSGLLDEADLGQLAAAIEPGSAAAVIVYENRWVLGLADTWRREGARLIADGGISADDLVDALDATERSFLGGDHVGILKTAATVAVASSVHGRVQRRQQQRWAAQDQPAAPAAPPPQVPARAPSSVDTSDRLAQLTQLGDLKNAGVLTEAEFEREKARILNG